MGKGIAVIAVAWVLLIAFPTGTEARDFEYAFEEKECVYAFRGWFVADARLDCLIPVIFEFKHISAYAAGAKSVDLLAQGKDWMEVRYIYRKMIFFENKSTWRRTLDREALRVDFQMLSSENNLAFLPDVKASRGYYQIKPEADGYRIEYVQSCELAPGMLSRAYIQRAKKESIRFLKTFRDYVFTTCSKSGLRSH